jgi:biopolymer transport protein ExbD
MDGTDIRRQVFRNLAPENSGLGGLRMAPMIDMVFLLLIFFLVAAKWRPEEDFLPIKLPSAQAGQNAVGRTEPLRIHIYSIDNGCRIQIGQVQVVEVNGETIEEDFAELASRIEAVLSSQSRFLSDPVEIICEPDVKSNYWVKIYNVLCGLKLTDITFTMTGQPQGK